MVDSLALLRPSQVVMLSLLIWVVTTLLSLLFQIKALMRHLNSLRRPILLLTTVCTQTMAMLTPQNRTLLVRNNLLKSQSTKSRDPSLRFRLLSISQSDLHREVSELLKQDLAHHKLQLCLNRWPLLNLCRCSKRHSIQLNLKRLPFSSLIDQLPLLSRQPTRS